MTEDPVVSDTVLDADIEADDDDSAQGLGVSEDDESGDEENRPPSKAPEILHASPAPPAPPQNTPQQLSTSPTSPLFWKSPIVPQESDAVPLQSSNPGNTIERGKLECNS